MQTFRRSQYDSISSNVNPVKRGDIPHVDYPPELKRLPLGQAAVAVFLLSMGAWAVVFGLSIGLRDVVIFVISVLP